MGTAPGRMARVEFFADFLDFRRRLFHTPARARKAGLAVGGWRLMGEEAAEPGCRVRRVRANQSSVGRGGLICHGRVAHTRPWQKRGSGGGDGASWGVEVPAPYAGQSKGGASGAAIQTALPSRRSRLGQASESPGVTWGWCDSPPTLGAYDAQSHRWKWRGGWDAAERQSRQR